MQNNVSFLNFGNDQTFHFFQWVMYSGKVPVDALIDRAWECIESSEDYRTEGAEWFAENVDVNAELCEEVVPLLEEVLEEAASQFLGVHNDLNFCGVQDYGVEEYSAPENMSKAQVDDLFGPILIEALRDIRFGAVAKALLKAKGRWHRMTNTAEA